MYVLYIQIYLAKSNKIPYRTCSIEINLRIVFKICSFEDSFDFVCAFLTGNNNLKVKIILHTILRQYINNLYVLSLCGFY